MSTEIPEKSPFSGVMMAFSGKNQKVYVVCMSTHQRVCLLQGVVTVARRCGCLTCRFSNSQLF